MSALEKRTVPELRFPGFEGEWNEKHGRDLFANSRAKGEEGLPIYSVTLNDGLVPRDSLERHMAADAAPHVSLRAKPGDLVYNMMRMWQGAVGRAEVECMVSPAYVVLSPKIKTDSKFFDYALQRARSLYDLWAYSYGLTDDRLRLYPKDFGQIPFRVPAFSEQQKIAASLGAVDAKLRALRRKRDLLQEYKRGMMRKIFFRELRFKRDDGSDFPDWEENRLGEVFEFVRTNCLSRKQLTETQQDLQNIHYGDIHTKFRAQFFQDKESAPFIKASAMWTVSDEEFCRVGDLVIADASEDYADIGKAIEIIQVKERSMVAGLHTYIVRQKNRDFVIGFAGYVMQSPDMRKQIMRIAQGISVLGISKPNLSKLLLWKPHPHEQQKIADFLSAFDRKIEAVARQIEQIELFKKGLLRKMFA